MDSKRDYSLDYIRIIAIMMIFTFHYCCTYMLTSSPFYIMANGGWGCPGSTVFFVLSGYLLRAKYSTITNIKDFYKKRFLSIFPMFYIAFIVCYIFTAIRAGNLFYAGNPIKFIFTLTGIDNYLAFYNIGTYAVVGEWFTAIIVAVYLIYPFFNKLYNRFKITTIIIVTGIYITNAFISLDPVIADASIFSGIFLFMAGMIIFDISSYLRKYYWSALIFISISLVIVFIPLQLGIPKVILSNILGICIFTFLLIILQNVDKLKTMNKAVKFISSICYSIYICHHFILNKIAAVISVYMKTNVSHIWGYLLSLAITIIVSIILYYVTNIVVKLISTIIHKQ